MTVALSQPKAQMQLTFLLMPGGWPHHINCRSVTLQCRCPSVMEIMQHGSAGPTPEVSLLTPTLRDPGLASSGAVNFDPWRISPVLCIKT